ncbi:MAG: DUF58 domain-containing protein [Chloroflexi bacterium]|nr:DUF58 domain-containing protein [Chloroflexota bacterium]
MIPTGRLLGLLLGAALPLGLSALWPPALALFPTWIAAALVALAVDWRHTPPPGAFTARRQHEPRLSLGAANPIRLHLASASPRSARLWVRDEYPPAMAADAAVLSLALPPLGQAELTYHLVPRQRGDYRFGALNLRYRSALGLFLRQVSFESPDPVRVYPNLLEVRKYDLLARRGALHEAGLRQARLHGTGTEFERLREYLPDDDYRRIHWKATARRGKPVSIEYEPERSQNVVIMLDAGRLMAAQAGDLTKLDHALNSALLVAYVASQRGDRVALLAFADRVLAYLPPRRGRRSFSLVLETLYNLHPQRVEPDFGRAFHDLARRQLKRSLLLLFTDLAEPEACAALLGHLARAARHHLPVCVTIADPVLATAAARPASGSQAVYERAVAQRLLDERQQVLATLRQRGVVTLDVAAERLTPAVVNTYLELKARTRL